jgi:hypothetical protein
VKCTMFAFKNTDLQRPDRSRIYRVSRQEVSRNKNNFEEAFWYVIVQGTWNGREILCLPY